LEADLSSGTGAAPAGPSAAFLPDGSPFRISAVLFDFDDTLARPGAIDFPGLRQAIGCPSGEGILEYLDSLSDEEVRERSTAILEEVEDEAAARSQPNEGARELVAHLRDRTIPIAIITRNRLSAVERALENFPGVDPADFAVIVSRDLAVSPKPSPAGVRYAAEKMDVHLGELLVIGDHYYDIDAGRGAGALTLYLDYGTKPPPSTAARGAADFVVGTLQEARRVIDHGLPLPVGKLPAEALREGLTVIEPADPSVIVGAGIGEDAAALDVKESEILVVASDPITLATDALARYAVLVNANDVATSGATPRWLLTTLLFPPGSSASQILAVMRDVAAMCAQYGVSLCGGHTEVTDAVTRPLVIGTMAGTARADELIDKPRMHEGDVILLTKGVAVEGTGLIAHEFGSRLAQAGMSGEEIAECGRFLDRVSILDEARIARSFRGVTALHDVTEGGLATAVAELGAAAGRRLRLDLSRIPVYPQTARICAALGIDPLGLIGSGSLLITCSPEDVGPLEEAIAAEGVEVTAIGDVLGPGSGVEAMRDGVAVEWPHFERDEVSRLGGPGGLGGM